MSEPRPSSNPFLRFAFGLVAAAVAIRVTIDLLEPVVPFLIGGIVLVGLVILVRWRRNNRW